MHAAETDAVQPEDACLARVCLAVPAFRSEDQHGAEHAEAAGHCHGERSFIHPAPEGGRVGAEAKLQVGANYRRR